MNNSLVAGAAATEAEAYDHGDASARLAMSVQRLDWPAITGALGRDGYAVLHGLIDAPAARALALAIGRHSAPGEDASNAAPGLWPDASLPLAPPASGGAAERIWTSSPTRPGRQIPADDLLPLLLQDALTLLYPHLAPIAQRWSDTLSGHEPFEPTLAAFIARQSAMGLRRPLHRADLLREGEDVPLHQCEPEARGFPLQLIVLLSSPGEDFDGGELVLTEQRPRMQSRPSVVPLAQGDVTVIATAERPMQGRQGVYRVDLRHGISRVRRGKRIGLELSFHHGP